MTSTKWIVSTPFAREHFDRGYIEGFKEGYKEAFREAFIEGYKQGLEEGRARARASVVIRVLLARGIKVSADERDRIRKHAEQPQEDPWLDRALTTASVDDLFS